MIELIICYKDEIWLEIHCLWIIIALGTTLIIKKKKKEKKEMESV